MFCCWLAYYLHARVELSLSHIGGPNMDVCMYFLLKALDTLGYLKNFFLEGHMEDDFILKRIHWFCGWLLGIPNERINP